MKMSLFVCLFLTFSYHSLAQNLKTEEFKEFDKQLTIRVNQLEKLILDAGKMILKLENDASEIENQCLIYISYELKIIIKSTELIRTSHFLAAFVTDERVKPDLEKILATHRYKEIDQLKNSKNLITSFISNCKNTDIAKFGISLIKYVDEIIEITKSLGKSK